MRGDLVLVRHTAIEKSLNRKMRPRYIGPLVVVSRNHGGAYIVCELDGSVWDRPIAQFRVLPYKARRLIPLPDLGKIDRHAYVKWSYLVLQTKRIRYRTLRTARISVGRGRPS